MMAPDENMKKIAESERIPSYLIDQYKMAKRGHASAKAQLIKAAHVLTQCPRVASLH